MVNIFACGDVLNTQISNGQICSEELAKIIRKADYSICNFEAPIENEGVKAPKSGPSLSQCASTIEGLKNDGFDLFLLANNHIMDFGSKALESTIAEAGKAGVETIGAGLNYEDAYKSKIKFINGVKIGIVNAGEAQFGVHDFYVPKNEPGYAWINHPAIDKDIIALKKECDFVIVFSHAGLENVPIPQLEWKMRYRHLCDLGADVIIGAHPHVPQGYEEYNNSYIFYSLGNFYFDWGEHSPEPSFSLLLHLDKGCKVNFELIHHRIQGNKVELLASDDLVDIGKLQKLLEINYSRNLYSISEEKDKLVRAYLVKSLSRIPTDGTLIGTVKEFISTLIGKRRNLDKDLTGLHFIRNESYHNVLKNSLTKKTQK